MAPVALFVGATRDPHLSLACERLEARGLRSCILDPTNPAEIDIRPAPFEIRVDGEAIEPALVWWRWKDPLFRRADPELSPVSRSEWRGVAQALRFRFADRNVHHPDLLNRAAQKALQLDLAYTLGFETPETLISSRPSSIRAFVQDQRIVKSICTPQVFNEDGFTAFDTQRIDAGLIASLSDDDLRSTPSLVQARLNKVAEVRVSFVCGALKARKYFPQAALEFDPLVRDDWRAMYRYAEMGLTPSEDVTLPEALTQKINAYAQRSGMRILCFDFAVLEDGAHVFLEANPDGQWLWLDDTGALMDAFVDWAERFAIGESVQ